MLFKNNSNSLLAFPLLWREVLSYKASVLNNIFSINCVSADVIEAKSLLVMSKIIMQVRSLTAQ
ncbi:MAG: hypothetical protein JWR09_4761 [Mucilaginibacter sp.]|nr:hypothetical protein [Mucilaginibacter sp.]